MKVKRTAIGSFAVFVMAISFVVIPSALAAKEPGHTAYTFCHRTGSATNPYVVITTDDAAWAEAHMDGSDPAHPVLDGRDDVFIGIDREDKKASADLCSKGGKGGE